MASLTLEHVSCMYRARRGAVHALDDLNLEVADREFMVLVGPSGCGKTTTLRLIAGLETPSQGTIRIGERVVGDVTPRDRDVAMVFQSYALYPHMTVYKNLAFGLRMRGVSKAQIAGVVESVAAKLGLLDLLDRKPHQLSGGEKQRVALGRAIVRKPQLFLLDEPLSNLDISLRSAMRAHIKALQHELATTMLYVTHDQEEAMTLAHRIAVLREGKLQQVGTPAEVYQRPANRFVAGFFGSPSMNFFGGAIDSVDGKLSFRGGPIRIDVPFSLVGRGASKEVVLGVRPHEVLMTDSDEPSGNTNCGVVRDVDLLGDCVTVRIMMDESVELTSKIPAATAPKIGQQVRVGFHPESIHIFEPGEAGRRLN